MKRIIVGLLLLLLSSAFRPRVVDAALASTTVWELRASATANMVNGGGFNASRAGAGTDYSLQDTAQISPTDLASAGSSTTLTSAAALFTSAMVGNVIHITTTGTGGFCVVGWYEITVFTDTSTVTLDRTPNSGTAGVACTGNVGGALNVGALEDSFFEAIVGGNTVWIKSGTYTAGAAISIASTASTTTSPSAIQGYSTTRGDNPMGSTRPLIALAANEVTFGQYQNLRYLRFTMTNVFGVTLSTGEVAEFSFFLNTSTTTGRNALNAVGSYAGIFACEAVSQNGIGIKIQASYDRIIGCYVHDSDTGISLTLGTSLIENVIAHNRTVAILGAYITASQNSFYGTLAKQGIGANLNGSNSEQLYNNILYGFVTGITNSSNLLSSGGDYNDYYNNTTDVTNFSKGPHDLAVDPQFTAATEITGATATTSGSVLTQGGGDFSTVTDSVDFLHVLSGTGVTTGGYLITSHTATTLTVNNALGTSSGGNVVYYVSTGHDFGLGTNLRAAGFPGAITGSESTSYLDTGAIQRQEPTAANTPAPTQTPVPTCGP